MTDKKSLLGKILRERILVLDGAMGTMIQQYELNETDFRGVKFAKHSSDLKGNNDILCLTKPQIISEIHEKYLSPNFFPDGNGNIVFHKLPLF